MKEGNLYIWAMGWCFATERESEKHIEMFGNPELILFQGSEELDDFLANAISFYLEFQ